MEEKKGNFANTVKNITSSLAIPARQAIEAAEIDSIRRYIKRPFGKLFVWTHDYLLREYNAHAAGADAALNEANKQLNQNRDQDLDDRYLSELIEARERLAQRSRLLKKNKIGDATDRSVLLSLAFVAAGISLLITAPFGGFLVGLAVFYAGTLIPPIVGVSIDSYKKVKVDRESNDLGEIAREEFQQLRSSGKSKIEAINIMVAKGCKLDLTRNRSDNIPNIENSQESNVELKTNVGDKKDKQDLLSEQKTQPQNFDQTSAKDPIKKGGFQEKELQRRANQQDSGPNLK